MVERPSSPPAFVAWLLLGLAVVGVAWSMAQTFGQPFEREWLGRNGSRYAHIARNYERDGLLALRGAPRLDVAGLGEGATPEIYAHHPPGVSMAIALATRVHGTADEDHAREDATRLVPAIATLVLLALFARLVMVVLAREAADRRAALWGAASAVVFVAAMPMTNVYGAHADPQGPPVLAASLLVLLAYERWQRVPGLGGALAVGAATVFASWFDWYALYTPVLCGLHLSATRPGRRAAGFGLVAFALAVFAGWVGWVVTLPTMSVERFADAIGVRASAPGSGEAEAFLSRFATWSDDFEMLVPMVALLLALVPVAFAMSVLRRRSEARKGVPQADGLGVSGLLGLLLLPPVIHAVLFPSGLVIHDYWLFGLPPALGFAAAVALQRLPWGVGLVVLVGYATFGALGVPRVLEQSVNPIPAMLGEALARRTAPGDVVLTSYATNPFSSRPEGYTMMEPAITFYSDRRVRGALTGLEAAGVQAKSWDEALAWAHAEAASAGDVWFLLDAWTARPSDALRAAVASATLGEPEQLDPTVDVWLHRLSPSDR